MKTRRRFLLEMLAAVATFLTGKLAWAKPAQQPWMPQPGDLVVIRDIKNFYNTAATGVGVVLHETHYLCAQGSRQCNQWCKHDEPLFVVDFGLVRGLQVAPSEMAPVSHLHPGGTIYYTPFKSNRIRIYDGSHWASVYLGTIRASGTGN